MGAGFEKQLARWELAIAQWGSAGRDALNEGVKLAMLLELAPDHLRQSQQLEAERRTGAPPAECSSAR